MTYERSKCVEALAWLEQQDGKERMISESSEDLIMGDDLLRLVQELYTAGAVEIRVCGLTIEEEFEDGNSLEIILPQDEEARAKLFSIQGRVLHDINSAFDQSKEHGQAQIGIAW